MERTLFQLLPGANKVENALRLRSKAFICRADSEKMDSVVKDNYTISFLIRSQINNIIIKQTLTVKGPRRVIIKLLKLGCPSTYFQLSGHILQWRPLYKISGVPICIQWPLY